MSNQINVTKHVLFNKISNNTFSLTLDTENDDELLIDEIIAHAENYYVGSMDCSLEANIAHRLIRNFRKPLVISENDLRAINISELLSKLSSILDSIEADARTDRVIRGKSAAEDARIKFDYLRRL